jgi:hypothetical protein
VSDPLPPDLAGKGQRVAGVFVVMIGASVILDTHLMWVGLPLLAVGTVLFARGMSATRVARLSQPLGAPHGDATPEMHP